MWASWSISGFQQCESMESDTNAVKVKFYADASAVSCTVDRPTCTVRVAFRRFARLPLGPVHSVFLWNLIVLLGHYLLYCGIMHVRVPVGLCMKMCACQGQSLEQERMHTIRYDLNEIETHINLRIRSVTIVSAVSFWTNGSDGCFKKSIEINLHTKRECQFRTSVND
jgi:hypothetical protein